MHESGHDRIRRPSPQVRGIIYWRAMVRNSTTSMRRSPLYVFGDEGHACSMKDHEFGISGRTDEQVCYRAPTCLSNDCERSRSCVPTHELFDRGYSRNARGPTPGHSTSSGSEHRDQVLTRTVRSTFFSSIPRRLPRLPVLITTFWRVAPWVLSAEPSGADRGVRGTALVAE